MAPFSPKCGRRNQSTFMSQLPSATGPVTVVMAVYKHRGRRRKQPGFFSSAAAGRFPCRRRHLVVSINQNDVVVHHNNRPSQWCPQYPITMPNQADCSVTGPAAAGGGQHQWRQNQKALCSELNWSPESSSISPMATINLNQGHLAVFC